MFEESTRTVRSLLGELVRTIKTSTMHDIDEMYVCLRRDVLSAVGGDHQQYGNIMPKEQRMLRQAVIELIGGTEDVFQRVIRGEAFVKDDETIEDAEVIDSKEELVQDDSGIDVVTDEVDTINTLDGIKKEHAAYEEL